MCISVSMFQLSAGARNKIIPKRFYLITNRSVLILCARADGQVAPQVYWNRSAFMDEVFNVHAGY